jgi:aryl-phospho-beta-D-glucosidase BglC (GH1 family)
MISHHLSLGLTLGGALLLGACGGSLSEPADDSAPVPFTGAPVMQPPASNMPPVQNPLTPPTTTPEQNPTPSLPPSSATQTWQPPATIDPSTPVGLHGQLRVQGTDLVDASGAVVQLKGISTMWLNWEDRYSTSKVGLQWMRDNWNITIYRAAMGVEPDGAYLSDPERALSQLRQVVHNAIDLGVYVLIDWHDHNAHLNQAESIAFFTQIAAEFGQYPHVLYETFNEPEQVDWTTQIKPYHEAVVPAIRAQDPDNVIILGSRQWSQRVDEAAANPVSGTNLMYTVHFYACDHQDTQRSEAQTAYDAGLALFVTEWGATPADGGASSPTVCVEAAQAWHDWMNERSIGWAAWKLDGCADSSCLFNSDQAPQDGGWTDEWLNGHAQFVVDRLRD